MCYLSEIVAVMALFLSAVVSSPVVHSDNMLIQGKWIVVSSESDGKKSEQPVGAVITVDGIHMTSRYKDKAYKDRYEIDPTKKPKWIDITRSGDDDEILKFRGIYFIEGHTLTICHAKPGDKRPTEFATKLGDKRSIAVMKRGQGKQSAPKTIQD